MPNSNIIDLVHTAVKPGVSVPTGAPEFTRALREHNIPKTALSTNACTKWIKDSELVLT